MFAPSVSLAGSPASEHFIASSLGIGGFASRDIYVAAGNSVVHIDHAGTTSNTFVSGLTGDVRGILFDSIGTFGHDMLITTSLGYVYRVNSLGASAILAMLGEDTEGLDIAPLGAGFGSFDGQLIVASEGSGNIRAISTGGIVSHLGLVSGAEMLAFVPMDLGVSLDPVEGFYAANYTQNVIKADSNQFAGFQGDAVITGEFNHQVSRMHWNGSAFEISNIGSFPGQPEDGIFVTRALTTPRTVPEPATLLGFGIPMLMVGLTKLRRLRK